MEFPALFKDLRHKPGMHFLNPTLEVAIAFVQGYDAATIHDALAGFREWLVVRRGEGNNLSWPALVRDLLEDQTDGETEQEALIEKFFALLEEFWRTRHSSDGLAHIFVRHMDWLRRQPWYRGDSPVKNS